MGVTQLGYVGIGTTRMEAWRDTVTGVIGAEILDPVAGDDAMRLRIDAMHHRLAIRPSDRDDVLYAGWQVESAREMDRLVAALDKAGARPQEGDAATCADRHVDRLVRFTDPDGYANELYLGPEHGTEPLRPSLPVSGFTAGTLGLGHVVRHCRRYREMVDFYADILSFRISDRIVWADMDGTFMRCNPRHHSLALLNESLGMGSGETNHVMLEYASLDDVGRAYDRVLRRGDPVIMSLGRHSNDATTSFYFVCPSGMGIELGTGGVLVDDADWQVKTFTTTRIWGHLLPHERNGEARG
ncbi:VOC family protein [Niveispirillum sp. KHB5.9]|uniref:VOC family protein n=1 Tax=Niveispirillum sp. KHB5.9 TaxID=3400269 RepID=UPI003A83758E